MTTTIDFRTMPRNVPSLCIPRVFPNIDERRIRSVFDDLNMGEIERVDIIKRTTEKGEKFNRVFIHWKNWNSSDNANQSRERLLNGKEIKIVYDDPWFWKISAYREPAARPTNRPPINRPAARISFDSDEDRPQRPRSPGIRPRRDDRRSDRRPRHVDNKRQRAKSPVRMPREKLVPQPTTPNCSPPRIREEDTYGREERDMMMATNTPEPVQLDYTNVPPPPKKLNFKAKKPIIVEEEAKEEGEA